MEFLQNDHSNLDLLRNNAFMLGGIEGAETKYIEDNMDITN